MKKLFLAAGLAVAALADGDADLAKYMTRTFTLSTKVGTAAPDDTKNCYPDGTVTLAKGTGTAVTVTLTGTWKGACTFLKDPATQALGPITLTAADKDLSFTNIVSPFDVAVVNADDTKPSTIKGTKGTFTRTVNTDDKSKDTVQFTIDLAVDASKTDGNPAAYTETVTFTGVGDVTCDAGSYMDATEKVCKPCPTGCATCTDANTCQTCKADSNTFLPKTPTADDHKCRTCHTDKGEFLDASAATKVCSPCSADGSCLTCTDAATCTKCKNHFGFADDTVKTCTACPKTNSFTNDQNKCTDCKDTCTKCDSLTVCTECKADNYLPKTPTPTDNVCRPCHADNGEFLDAAATPKVCVACPQHCHTCDSLTVCKTCKGRSGLKDDKLCHECGDREISKNSVCETCAPLKFVKNDQCEACPHLEIAEGKGCKKCDAGHIANAADNTCKKCADNEIAKPDNTCGTCAAKQFIENHECKDCPKDCTACTATACTACVEGFAVKEGKCQKKSSSTLIIIIVIIVLLVLAVVGFFLYRKKQADDLRASLVYKQQHDA